MSPTENLGPHGIPITALRASSKEKICAMLNSCLVIPSPDGLPRDWRGLAELLDVSAPFGCLPNPTEHILQQYEKIPNSSIQRLQDAFGELDRWDVYDDTEDLLSADCRNYLQVKESSSEVVHSVAYSLPTEDIVTLDDQYRAQNNLPLQEYDVFILFADEDVDFAAEVIDKLEKEFLAKVCYKDRDFLPSIDLEHISVMNMLKKRCRHCIFIISNSFIQSDFNKYFLNFASAISIEQRRIKIIPLVKEYCFDLPMVVKHCHLLDYSRRSPIWNFWDKLRLTVVGTKVVPAIAEGPVFEDKYQKLNLTVVDAKKETDDEPPEYCEKGSESCYSKESCPSNESCYSNESSYSSNYLIKKQTKLIPFLTKKCKKLKIFKKQSKKMSCYSD